MTALRLRPYQDEAVRAFMLARQRGVQRPALVLGPGAGKTVIKADIGVRALRGGVERVLYLAHREELLDQIADKVRSAAPDRTVGIVAADRNNVGARFVVGSVQTLRNPKRLAQVRNVGLVAVDEAHHAAADSYRFIMDELGCFTPGGTQALGVTATMERGDGKALGQVWQEIVYEKSIKSLIRDGWLVQPRGGRAIHVRVENLNLERVKTKRGGDFADGALGEVMSESLAPKRIVEAYLAHAAGRQAVLFGPTVDFAELMRDEFRAHGLRAELVHATTPKAERRDILARFRAGGVDVLCNCGVFTEGTDLPMIGCVIIARPTKLPGLFIQMAGRGARLWPGKTDYVLLDVVGASQYAGLATLSTLEGDDDLERGEGGPREPMEPGEPVEKPTLVYADGELIYGEVDLFRDSRMAWLRTAAGVWFLAAGGSAYVAIVPGPLGWDVVRMNKDRSAAGVSSWWVQRGIPDMSYAMAWAEGAVTDTERALTSRSARWRGAKPSEAQLKRARWLGIVEPERFTRGLLSNEMDIREASHRIDSCLTPLMRQLLLTSQ